MKNVLLIFNLLLLGAVANAQYTEQWAARYTARDTSAPWYDADVATAVWVDPQGNVITTGYSMRGEQDIVTFKYNAAGVEQCREIYSGSTGAQDGVSAITGDAQGNIYMVGHTNFDALTLKYNASGALQWAKKYTSTPNRFDGVNEIAVDASGNVYVAGRTEMDSQSFNILLIKYDASGNQVWLLTYDGPGHWDDYANGLVLDAAGNAYVCGEVRDSSGSKFDFVTIKWSSSGNREWVKLVNGTVNRDDRAFGITTDNLGNVITVGSTQVDANAVWMSDYLMVKYDALGNEVWRKTFNGAANNSDAAVDVRTDATGNIYVAGNSVRNAAADYHVMKLNSLGDTVWTDRYNTSTGNSQTLTAMLLDAMGNMYVTGSSQGPNGRDFQTVMWDSAGTRQWALRYDGPAHAPDEAWAIAMNVNGILAVAGQSVGFRSANDYATVVYSDSTLTAISEKISAGNIGRIICYPNPITTSATLQYSLKQLGEVSVQLLDMTGRVVANLVNETLQAGTHELTVDATSLESGVYFCAIRAGEQRGVIRLVVE